MTTSKKQKPSGDQTQRQKSNQKNTFLGNPLCKILLTILKTDKGAIQTDGQMYNKIWPYWQIVYA